MIILAAFALIFLCAAPIVILYSKGYVFDMTRHAFVQTGALFLKTIPQDVVLKIGPSIKTVSQQSILYNGIFVRNLVPKTYRVQVTSVQNPGASWEKNLDINPLIVTKETRIALPVPQFNPTFQPFATSAPAFQEQISDTMLLYATDTNHIERLDMTSGNQTAFATLPNSNQTTRDPISDISVSMDADQAVIKTKNQTLFWFHGSFLNAQTYLATFMKNENTVFTELSFYWHPTQDQMLIILTPKAGYLLDTQANTYRQFSANKVLGLSNAGSGSYYVAADSSIKTLIPLGQNQALQSSGSLASWKNANAFWKLYELPDSQVLAWQKNGPLILLDTQTQQTSEIGSRVDAMRISPDQNRVAFADGARVSVKFLRGVFDDVQYAKGQTIQLSEETEPVENLFFTNDTWYVAAVTQHSIAVMEIDTRDPLNVWRIGLPDSATHVSVDNASVYWIVKADWSSANLFAR